MESCAAEDEEVASRMAFCVMVVRLTFGGADLTARRAESELDS